MNEKPVFLGPPQHPWQCQPISSYYNFNMWLNAWHSTEDAEIRFGLLHALTLNERAWSFGRERVVSFLLDMADGYQYATNFRDEREDESRSDDDASFHKLSVSQLRQKLAHKAFKVLCEKLFRPIKARHASKPLCQWWWILEHPELINKLVWFFRPSPYGRILNFYGVTNIRDDQFDQVSVRDFLYVFAKLPWSFTMYDDECRHTEFDDRIRASLATIRTQCLEILEDLQDLGWLACLEKLDRATRCHLLKMVLGKDCWFPHESCSDGGSNHRKPESLEEAILGGSQAAIILIRYDICRREQIKFARRMRKSMRARDECRRLVQIAELEKQKQVLEKEQRALLERGKK